MRVLDFNEYISRISNGSGPPLPGASLEMLDASDTLYILGTKLSMNVLIKTE